MIYRCFKSGSLTLLFFVLSFTYPLEIFSGQKKSISAVAQTPQSPKPSTESKKTNQSQTSEARFVDYFAQERLLQGHKGSVNDASFSPDGKYIVTAGSDGDTRLWNISSKETRLVSNLQGHRGNVKTANFSPDGKLIVTSSFDRTVRVWNLLGNELAVLKGHRGNVYSASFSPDGKRIVTTGADKTVRLWDVSGQQLAEITGHNGSVYSANFSPNGKQIVTASADKTARLWDISGKLLAQLQGHTDTVWSANFSPDGKRIVTASDDKTARIWDVSGKLLAVLSGHKESVYSADFSTDGKQIVTASLDFTGLIWDASGKLVGKLEQHTGGVNSAGFSRDGKWIVTASNDGTVRVWDLSTKLSTELQGHLREVDNVSFSPDGKLILTVSRDMTVRIWDIHGKEVKTLKHKRNVESASFSPDGKMIITLYESKVGIWDISGKFLTEISGLTPVEIKHTFPNIEDANFSPDSKYVITAGYKGTVRIWNINGKLITELTRHQGRVNSANFSPNGNFIVTAFDDKTAAIWDISGKKLLELNHPERVKSAIFSPDSNLILTKSNDNTNGIAYVWNMSGKLLMKIKQGILFSEIASFSPDSKLIVTTNSKGNEDYKIYVWDLLGNLQAEFEGHNAKFSSDGKNMITTSTKTAFLWNISSGKLLGKLKHSNAVLNIDFSPDGQHIVTDGDNARVWYLSDENLAKYYPLENKLNDTDETQRPSLNSDYFPRWWRYKNASFSPNNRYVIILSNDVAELWDISGKLLSELKVNQASISSASFSPDGEQIITGSTDGIARLWNISGKLLQKLEGHENYIANVEFAKDGKRVYTVTNNKTIRIWNISGKLIKKYKGSQNKFENINFSSNKKKIITTKFKDNIARIWNISGKLLTELKGHEEAINSAYFNADGKKVITASDDGTVRIWNTKGKQLALIKVNNENQFYRYVNVQNAKFSPNGKLIITTQTFSDNTAKIWDINGNLLTEMKGHNGSINSAQFSIDGKRVITTSDDKTARIWNISGKQLQVIKRYANFENASYSPDGKRIITISASGTAQIWDTLSGKLLAEIKEVHKGISNTIINLDSKLIVTTSLAYGNASLWDIDGKHLMKFKGESRVKNVIFSPTRKKIITLSPWGDISVWNISGKKLVEIKERKVSIANFTPDEQHIVTVCEDNTVRIWDISGKLLTQIKGYQDKIIGFIISPDNKQILTVSLNGLLRLWNITGKLLKTISLNQENTKIGDKLIFNVFNKMNIDNIKIKVHNKTGQINGYVTISSSKINELPIMGSIDITRITGLAAKQFPINLGKLNQINIDNINFKKQQGLEITGSAEFSVSLSDVKAYFNASVDEKKSINMSAILAAEYAKTVILMNFFVKGFDASSTKPPDISQGVPIQLKGHQDSINSINFSSNGKYIITTSDDGTARIWDTNGKLISTLSLNAPTSSVKVEADRLRDLEFYAPNCSLALKPWQKALTIYQKISDYKNQAVILQKLGNVYYCINDYTQAIKHYLQAVRIAKRNNYLKLQTGNFAKLGSVYHTLADYNQALKYYNKALKIIETEKNSKIKAETLFGRANVYNSLGEYDKAISDYSQISSNDTKTKLADIYLASGDYARAIQFYKEALQIQSIEALSGLGNTYLFLGDTTKAINYYQQSLEKARQIEDKEAEANALNSLANALRKLNKDKLSEAEKYLLAAIEIWENLRVNLEDANKISIFEKQTRTYRLLQEILIAQNKIEEALEISERGRARAFVELLSKRLSPDKNEESQIALPNINQIQKIAKAQNSTLIQYSIITDEFKINGKPQTKESELYTWVVKPSGEVSFRQTDLKPLWQNENTNLSKLIKNTRLSIGAVDIRSRQAGGLIASGNNLDKEKQTRSLQRLHQLLINPIADLLPKNPSARVTFIPQDSLFLVPFPALQNKNGQYLIEKHTILTSPSIQVLDLTRKQKQKNSLTKLDSSNALVVGNPEMPSIALQPGEPAKKLPNLPGAETEAKAIAPMLNTKAITGSAATEAEIVQKMPKAQIIHLATHGLFDDLRGLGSALAFNTSPKDDGLLTAEEILDMKLNADLVVLSACDTGRGRITGDGVIGLSRSFISAGVPSIVVSLWSVDDDSTAFLMTEFYQNLQQGIDKGTALRKAMLSAKEKYENPLQWAAFTLIGEAE